MTGTISRPIAVARAAESGLHERSDRQLGSVASRWRRTPAAGAARRPPGCYAASIMRRAAFGPTGGKRIVRLGGVANAPWVELNRRRHAHNEGFDLHADVAIAQSDRQGLEQVLRYGARPAVAGERLRFTHDGRIALELKRRYHDGTTHLVFEPLAFVERLAALIPKPNKNLVIYSSVLAPNAKLRPPGCVELSASTSCNARTAATGRSQGSGGPSKWQLTLAGSVRPSVSLSSP